MARSVCRCPWCQRMIELETQVVAVERWVVDEGSRPREKGKVGRPPVPDEEAAGGTLRSRRHRARQRADREGSGDSGGS
jgi:hypothetical protein